MELNGALSNPRLQVELRGYRGSGPRCATRRQPWQRSTPNLGASRSGSEFVPESVVVLTFPGSPGYGTNFGRLSFDTELSSTPKWPVALTLAMREPSQVLEKPSDLVCDECGAESDEWARGERALVLSDVDELRLRDDNVATFCPDCAARELDGD